MIVLGVAGISILIIIYLYVRSDGLRRELAGTKRQLSTLSSEARQVEEVVNQLAYEQQIVLRKSLTRAKNFGHVDNQILKVTEALVEGIVNVCAEAARGHKTVVEAFRKHLARTTDMTFDDFNNLISDQADSIKMEWHKKSVLGYLTVCRLMIDVLGGTPVDESDN